ncbi:MAG: hypothetical protein ACD_23C01143G0001 [uncultured bacterium]|nr:MAG: hypothetical protein ACD_23C01143G0001 [uncultured bacterium]
MKRNKLYVRPKWSDFLLPILVVFILPPPTDALAVEFIGNYCWTITITDSTVTGLVIPSTAVLKSDIVNMGGTSYALTGTITDPGDNPYMLGGVAQSIGSKIYMHLTGSQSHLSGGWRDSSVIYAELDASTLSGTMYDMGNDFNVVTRTFNLRYTAGTIAPSVCP